MKICSIDEMERDLCGTRHREKAKPGVQRNWANRATLRAIRKETCQCPPLYITILEACHYS